MLGIPNEVWVDCESGMVPMSVNMEPIVPIAIMKMQMEHPHWAMDRTLFSVCRFTVRHAANRIWNHHFLKKQRSPKPPKGGNTQGGRNDFSELIVSLTDVGRNPSSVCMISFNCVIFISTFIYAYVFTGV